jgi:hypothetical protein
MTPLRRRMIDDMQVRNRAPRAQISYVEQVDRFARHFRIPEASRDGRDPGLAALPGPGCSSQFDLACGPDH